MLGILNVMPKAGWANRTFLLTILTHACEGGVCLEGSGCLEGGAGQADCMAAMPRGLWHVVPLIPKILMCSGHLLGLWSGACHIL